MSGWSLEFTGAALGIGVFVYFCSLYGRSFAFSKVRLVGLALGCALLLVPVVWKLHGPSLETPPAVPSVLLAVAFGFVLGVFALAVSCQRRKSSVGSAISKYLNCQPR